SRLLLAVGIVLLGLCAAWPFRRPARQAIAVRERPAPLSLTLRRPDAPLEIAPRMDVSPAVGLAEGDKVQRTRDGGHEPRMLGHAPSDLSNLVPPPALPVSFQPSTATPQASDWRPEPVVRLPHAKSQPR